MNERIQQQLSHFRKVVSQEKASSNAHARTGQSKDDSLSTAIRSEKDGKIFMAELKNAKERAR